MKIGAIPETIPERIALALGLVPTPLVDTNPTFILARVIVVATKLGLFEALGTRSLTAAAAAAACGIDPAATIKLLEALASSGYLRRGAGGYQLTRSSRAWLLRASRTSLYDAILFTDVEWKWMTDLEHYVRSGQPLD